MDFKVKKWQASAGMSAIAKQLMLLGVPFIFDGKAPIFDAPEVLVKTLPWLDSIICGGNITAVTNEKAVGNRR